MFQEGASNHNALFWVSYTEWMNKFNKIHLLYEFIVKILCNHFLFYLSECIQSKLHLWCHLGISLFLYMTLVMYYPEWFQKQLYAKFHVHSTLIRDVGTGEGRWGTRLLKFLINHLTLSQPGGQIMLPRLLLALFTLSWVNILTLGTAIFMFGRMG